MSTFLPPAVEEEEEGHEEEFLRYRAVTARSLIRQNPEPRSGKAWCVPPAVLQAKPRSRATSAASNVPPTHGRFLFDNDFLDHSLNIKRYYQEKKGGGKRDGR